MSVDKQVLLLNSTEEILTIISWKKAIKLLMTGKAVAPYNYKKNYKVQAVNGRIRLPAALVLVKYVFLPHETRNLMPTRQNIFKRDKYNCQYCGTRCKDKKKLTIDHVHPRSRGGGTQWTNVVACCFNCNQKKGSRLLKHIPDMSLINKPRRPKVNALEMWKLTEEGRQLWKRWLFYT